MFHEEEDVNENEQQAEDLYSENLLEESQAKMKSAVVADEMFPEGVGPYMDVDEAGGSSSMLMDLTANDKMLHGDFANDFGDVFDDDDI